MDEKQPPSQIHTDAGSFPQHIFDSDFIKFLCWGIRGANPFMVSRASRCTLIDIIRPDFKPELVVGDRLQVEKKR